MNLQILTYFVKIFFILCYTSATYCDEPISMYQTIGGDRSIGSNVTVISEVNYQPDEPDVELTMFITSSPELTPNVNYSIVTYYYKVWNATAEISGVKEYKYLNLSESPLQLDTRKYTWEFSYLPENYNELTLWTTAGAEETVAHTLHVQSCKPNKNSPTTGDTPEYTVTTDSPGHFKDNGSCSCVEDDRLLFNDDGTRAEAETTCNLFAVWENCDVHDNLQCYYGPDNATVTQNAFIFDTETPFNCSYSATFPETANATYSINDEMIPDGYILDYTDDGKNLSCTVTSEYTKATDTTIESANILLTVYYPPKESNLSKSSFVMEVDGSKLVNFTFKARSRTGNVSLEFKDTNGNAVSSTIIDLEKNYTEDTLYAYELRLNVSLTGVYNVCAKSFNPGGEDCSTLTISNMTATTTVTTYTTTLFSNTTIESTDKEPKNIGIIVGAAVGGVVALLLVIAAIYFVRRKRGKNSSNKKEERINEIYESTPNPGPSTETVYTVAGNSQAEMKTNEMYEASPQQPEIQDVYTTVNRDNKLKGKNEKDSSENAGIDSTSAEANGPAVADVYAMVKK